MKNKIIAVDFDGTLCENKYPEAGEPRDAVIRYIINEQAQGARLILWTNRTNEALDFAVKWCIDHGIVFDTVNQNIPEIIDAFDGEGRKIFADEYIDDRALTPEMIEEMEG